MKGNIKNINIVINNNTKDNDIAIKTKDDTRGSTKNIFIDISKSDLMRPLGRFKPGSIVKIGNREFVVLNHSCGNTELLTKNIVKHMSFGNSNDYRNSMVREYLDHEFYEELRDAVGSENIILHNVSLAADDGTGKGSSLLRRVSLLTTDLYRLYREFIPKVDSCWWTATPVTADKSLGYTRDVCGVGSCGVLGWSDCGSSSGVRPFCTLKSSLFVSPGDSDA